MGVDRWYGGIRLSTEFELPELSSCSGDHAPDLKVRLADEIHPPPGAWLHQWWDDSELLLAVANVDGRFVLTFDDGRSFTFDPDARSVTCPHPIDASVRHQLLDQVLPRVLEHLGHLLIHASAVRTPGGVVMFVAETGAGKSTLAASFQAAGVELLSDDCMQLFLDRDDVVRCMPTYRSLRLWSDSADAIMASEPYEPMSPGSDKRRVDLSPGAPTAPGAVIAICVLTTADDDPHDITISAGATSPSGVAAAGSVLPARPDRRRFDEAHVRPLCRRRRAHSRRGTHLPS